MKIQNYHKTLMVFYLSYKNQVLSIEYQVLSMQIINLDSLSEEKKLFYHMHHGLSKAKLIKQFTIFLIGEIRSGKSTTFNWITNPSCLVGKGNEISSQYLLREENESIALVKDTYESVTLVQNMHKVKDHAREALLVDLPGFHDSRTVNEVMLVNFIINCCFSHSTYAKFIIVISKNQFLNINGNAFINTIKEFVKYFKNFDDEQRRKVYRSASLLITSVDIKSYDSYKQMYLIKLAQNLNKIKDMRAKNEQIRVHYDHMEQLLQGIIHSKRLQLFKMAKEGQSPSASPIIQQFNCCDWQFYDLGVNVPKITYSYNEYYQRISEEDQQKIDCQIINRVKLFESLQDILAKIVEEYLLDPYDRQMDLSQHFDGLQQFVNLNRVHNDIPFIPQVEQQEILEDEPTLKPLKIFRNIQRLIHLTFQVQDNGCRPLEQQRKQNYFDYLLPYFQKTINYFADSFAVIPRYKQILDVLLLIFSETIEELKYITQINDSLKSSCSRHLKQAILVMNRTSHFKEDIPKPFLKGLVKEEFQEYEIQQLEQTLQFIKNLNWDELDPRRKYFVSSKCHKAMAIKMRQKNEYDTAIDNAFACFENHMKYQYCQQIKKTRKSSKHNEQGNEINFSQCSYDQILQQIYLSLYNKVQRKEIVQFFIKNHLFIIIQQSLPQLQKATHSNQSIILLQDYASIYEESGQYDLAKSIYKRLEKHPELKGKKKKQQQFKQKSVIAEKLYTSTKNTKKEEQFYVLNDDKKALQLVNQIRLQILNLKSEYNKAAMIEEVKKYYEQKNQQANASQFQYKLAKDPTYCDIIIISQRLIKMIKNRKAIIMLGKRSGKTTAFYWLMKKPLITKMVGNKRYAYQLASANIQNRINHKGFAPTYIPNIGQFQPGQVLIDFSNLFHKKIINIMIQLNILKNIFENCQGIKFLIVGKQEDILKEDCKQLLKTIKFCLSVLPQAENLSSHFALLISYFENIKKYQDFFQQFINQFQQINDSQQFQERYDVKFSNKKYYKQIISNLSESNKAICFPKASQKPAPQSNFSQFANQSSWAHIESSKLRTKQLQTYLQSLKKESNEIDTANTQVKLLIRQVKIHLRKLGEVFQNSVQNKKLSKEFLLKIDQSFIDNWIQQEQICYQNYPQLLAFNQIFPLLQLSRFSNQINCFSIPFSESRQMVKRLITSMKKLKFASCEGMMALEWIQAKFIEATASLMAINQFRFQFDCQLSDLRYIFTQFTWIFNHQNFFLTFLQKYVKEIDIDKLIKEMVDNKMNVSNNLIKFINKCFQIKKQYGQIQLSQKMAEVAKKLKQLMLIQQNHSNSLYTCIVLFQLKCQQYHTKLSINRQSNQNEQHEVDFKISLLQILKEIAVILACLDKDIAFGICEILKCDACKCSVFDKLISISREKEPILMKYLDFCLEKGLKNQYIQLCSKFTAIATDEAQKQKYNSIKHEILANTRELTNIKKTAYDNVNQINISKLQQIFKQVKSYWEQRQQ